MGLARREWGPERSLQCGPDLALFQHTVALLTKEGQDQRGPQGKASEAKVPSSLMTSQVLTAVRNCQNLEGMRFAKGCDSHPLTDPGPIQVFNSLNDYKRQLAQ